MENYIGLAAVFAAFIFSRDGWRVPAVIVFYYVSFLLLRHFYIDDGSAFVTVEMSKSKAAEWFVLFTAINTIVIIALLGICQRTLLVKLYAAIVALSALHNTFGLFFSSLSMNWYADVYLLHQQYAIQLDILVAWLASDNAISRKINGAFNLWRKENQRS